ncbi:hypothetical protein B0F90DRAFT_1822696 [Multifurca ochricompacta]|uniref:Uncharacterized protein n=1 Tax=Multifurca ochricompacta TaxID=376703 RepID=A0AAD4QJW8_9AGAM|nr:hypothetical protein B0F90DRAFT_1822696 [Multifurca ochricompacta]
MNPYPQAPFKPHNISPDSVIRYSSTPVMKAPQYDEPSQGAQPLKEPTVMTRASTPLLPPSPQQAISQSGTSTPPLSPRGSRDSAFSSDTYQSADMSTSWAGIGKENDYVNSSPGTYDPEENALLDGWNPGQANITESTFPGGGYPSDLTAYNRTFGFPVGLTTEEREVRVGAAELVHPKHRLVRGGRAELIAEGSREDIYGSWEGDNDPPTAPIEGWVRVNVAQPGLSTPSASQNSRPSSQLSLQSKSSSLRPPMPPQKPPFARNLDSVPWGVLALARNGARSHERVLVRATYEEPKDA